MSEMTVMRTWAALEMFLEFAERADETATDGPPAATRSTRSAY
jgi:hypothetical protein